MCSGNATRQGHDEPARHVRRADYGARPADFRLVRPKHHTSRIWTVELAGQADFERRSLPGAELVNVRASADWRRVRWEAGRGAAPCRPLAALRGRPTRICWLLTLFPKTTLCPGPPAPGREDSNR